MPVHDHSKPICPSCAVPPSTSTPVRAEHVNRIRYPRPNVLGARRADRWT